MSETEDTEAVILTRADKLKQWWEIGGAIVKIVKFVGWAFKWLFYGGAAAVAVGQVTGTTPLQDAAVEIGVLDEPPPMTIDQLWVKVMEHEELIEVLQLPHKHKLVAQSLPDHDHPAAPPGPAGKDGESITGPAGPAGPAGKDGKSITGPQGLPGTGGIDEATFNALFDERIKPWGKSHVAKEH